MANRHAKYLALIQRHPLRPIRTEKDLDRALEIIDGLIDRPALSADESDYLIVLSSLVETYEDEAYPMPIVADDRILRHLIEAKGITQTELAEETGLANSTISAVLKGTRRLTRAHIGRLASYFHVEPGVFHFGAGKEPRPPARRQPGAGHGQAALPSHSAG